MIRKAYFAGGCFWCITPIFKIYKVKKVTCGYSGGNEVNPKYEDVKAQKTKHRETIEVEYDDEEVSYQKLVEIFINNVDTSDDKGQYIDRGYSYTLAIYYNDEEELKVIKKLVDSNMCISVEKFKSFYKAEEYHQDYYLKNPEAFEKELRESGRKK